MSIYNLYWKNNAIGQFEEESFDMGYLDGKLISNKSKISSQFIKTATNLDVITVMSNHKNGIRASLKEETSTLINVLVLGLTEKMELSLKLIIGKQEVIKWYLENVPEDRLLETTHNNNTNKKANNITFWSKLKSLWS